MDTVYIDAKNPEKTENKTECSLAVNWTFERRPFWLDFFKNRLVQVEMGLIKKIIVAFK